MTLRSIVINDLLNSVEDPILYFYCDYSKKQKYPDCSCLASLLRMLIEHKHKEEHKPLSDAIKDLYKDCTKRSADPDLSELEQTLRSSLALYP